MYDVFWRDDGYNRKTTESTELNEFDFVRRPEFRNISTF